MIMTKQEAELYAARFERSNNVQADVIRMLEYTIDPPVDGDNGWDVRVTYLPELNNYED